MSGSKVSQVLPELGEEDCSAIVDEELLGRLGQ